MKHKQLVSLVLAIYQALHRDPQHFNPARVTVLEGILNLGEQDSVEQYLRANAQDEVALPFGVYTEDPDQLIARVIIPIPGGTYVLNMTLEASYEGDDEGILILSDARILRVNDDEPLFWLRTSDSESQMATPGHLMMFSTGSSVAMVEQALYVVLNNHPMPNSVKKALNFFYAGLAFSIDN